VEQRQNVGEYIGKRLKVKKVLESGKQESSLRVKSNRVRRGYKITNHTRKVGVQ